MFFLVCVSQVLQRSVDRELNLYSDPKERNNKVASVTVLALSSQPVDHEENGRLKLRGHEAGESSLGLRGPQFSHYCKTSNIRHTVYQNLNVSWLVMQLSWPNPLKPGVKSRKKM